MRYAGGGIGHLNLGSKITNSDAMDTDTTHDRDAHMAAGEDQHQQVQQLERLAQDAILNHDEHWAQPEDADQVSDGDEGSSEASSGWDSSSDADGLESDNSDMGPEDEEGFGNGSDDGYSSP